MWYQFQSTKTMFNFQDSRLLHEHIPEEMPIRMDEMLVYQMCAYWQIQNSHMGVRNFEDLAPVTSKLTGCSAESLAWDQVGLAGASKAIWDLKSSTP